MGGVRSIRTVREALALLGVWERIDQSEPGSVSSRFDRGVWRAKKSAGKSGMRATPAQKSDRAEPVSKTSTLRLKTPIFLYSRHAFFNRKILINFYPFVRMKHKR